MELELGLKITRTIDDFRTTDFRIAKDRAGFLFLSRETDAMFILNAHLKGYKREYIKININEDGTLISVSGEKKVQETIIKGWGMYKKEPEIRGFEKIFLIPSGVNLDKIKAKYNDDDSTLTIYMSKLNKGIVGQKIQEFGTTNDKNNNDDDQILEQTREEGEEENEIQNERPELHAETSQQEEELCGDNNEEKSENNNREMVKEDKRKKFNLCSSNCFFLGSALIASLVAMVFGFVKSKRRRDRNN